jgi:hypothetical protein
VVGAWNGICAVLTNFASRNKEEKVEAEGRELGKCGKEKEIQK